jgi:tight adherence protein B
MSTALLSAALAVLLWPDRRGVRRSRFAAVTGHRAGRGRRVPRFDDVPVPLAAAAVAGAGAAVVSTPLVAVLAGTAAFAGGRVWATARVQHRSDSRLQALTDGLGALAADLRSGRSLEAATDAAMAACADEECGRALGRAVRLPGAAPPDRRPADDPGDLDEALARISAAVLLSTRTGCSLAAVAGAVEDDLRARRRHRLELRSATAAPRASAALLAGLPLLGLAMGSGVGADPWQILTATGTGQVLLVAGVALEVAGLAWSRRLVERAVR